MAATIIKQKLMFCLLLLLTICCSATNSFQQLDDYRRQQSRTVVTPLAPTTSTSTSLTITAATSAAIGVYGGGGGGVYGAASTIVDRRPRWNIFEPDRQQQDQQQEQDRQQQQQQQQQQRWRKQRRQRSRAAVALNEEEYARRKQEWADRYATLDGLRATFGSNKNKIYGDLDATTTRKLYKSLLPTAVCELVLDLNMNMNMNMNRDNCHVVCPEELAQLAFEARKAAKLYARERCHVPARLLAKSYDGFRALKRYGRFQTEGMSYDQVFDKYYQRQQNRIDDDDEKDWTEEDIVTRTCMQILESACRTNPLIDQMTLKKKQKRKRNNKKKNLNNNNNNNDNDNDSSEREDLEKIAQTLEEDVRKLLDPYNR